VFSWWHRRGCTWWDSRRGTRRRRRGFGHRSRGTIFEIHDKRQCPPVKSLCAKPLLQVVEEIVISLPV